MPSYCSKAASDLYSFASGWLKEVSTHERLKAEAARRARQGQQQPCDHGLFSSDAQQLDLVEEAKKL